MPLKLISEKLLLKNLNGTIPTGWTHGSEATHVAAGEFSGIVGGYFIGPQHGLTPVRTDAEYRAYLNEGQPTSLHTLFTPPGSPETPTGPGGIAIVQGGAAPGGHDGDIVTARGIEFSPATGPQLVVDKFSHGGTHQARHIPIPAIATPPYDFPNTQCYVRATGSASQVISVTAAFDSPSPFRGWRTYVYDENLALTGVVPMAGASGAHIGYRPTAAVIPCLGNDLLIIYSDKKSGAQAIPQDRMLFSIASLPSFPNSGVLFVDGPDSTQPAQDPSVITQPVGGTRVEAFVDTTHVVYVKQIPPMTYELRVFNVNVDSTPLSFPPATVTMGTGPFTIETMSGFVTNQPTTGEIIKLSNGNILIPYANTHFPGPNSRLLEVDPTNGNIVSDMDLGYVGHVEVAYNNGRIYLISHRLFTAGGNLTEEVFLETFYEESEFQPQLSLSYDLETVATPVAGIDVHDFFNKGQNFLVSDTQNTQPTTTGVPPEWTATEPTTHGPSYNGLVTTYVWYETVPTLFPTITFLPNFDTVMFSGLVDANISLDIMDRVNGSEDKTNETTVSADVTATGGDAGLLEYIISDIDVTAPLPTDPRFDPTIPDEADVTPPDGLKTVYLWALHTPSNNVLGATDNITLDQTTAVYDLVLQDRTDGSTSQTDEQVISVSFNEIVMDDESFCFLSETQTTPPDPTDPNFSAPGTFFFLPFLFPQTYQLSSGGGTKTVYLWCKESETDTIYGTSETILLSAPTPDIDEDYTSSAFLVGVEPVLSFTHVLTHGANLVSPAVRLSPNPLRAGYFLQDAVDTLFYLDSSSNLLFVAGFEIVGNPGDPSFENDAVNIQLEAGKAYLVNPVLLPLGQIRTISFTGTALKN